eukprot:SAG31_NODE_1735_length_7410_cov_2.762960_2_plen_155_part_00
MQLFEKCMTLIESYTGTNRESVCINRTHRPRPARHSRCASRWRRSWRQRNRNGSRQWRRRPRLLHSCYPTAQRHRPQFCSCIHPWPPAVRSQAKASQSAAVAALDREHDSSACCPVDGAPAERLQAAVGETLRLQDELQVSGFCNTVCFPINPN